MRTFRQLKVWQHAHQLVLETYHLTRSFPSEERYGLTQQMRRAAISIAANITEGHQRKSKAEFLHFLNIAHGSLDERQYYLILATDLRYATDLTKMSENAEEVGRMLNGLTQHIQQEIRHA